MSVDSHASVEPLLFCCQAAARVLSCRIYQDYICVKKNADVASRSGYAVVPRDVGRLLLGQKDGGHQLFL